MTTVAGSEMVLVGHVFFLYTLFRPLFFLVA